MIFKYRGFMPDIHGKEIIIRPTGPVKGKWIKGFAHTVTDLYVYITDEESGETLPCLKNTAGVILEILDANGNVEKTICEDDIVDFYVTHKPSVRGGYYGPVQHRGRVIYNIQTHEWELDADRYYNFSEADTFFVVGNMFDGEEYELR